MKFFGQKISMSPKARVTYTIPIPKNLVDWDSIPVIHAMRDWTLRILEKKEVQDFLRTAPEHQTGFWWAEEVSKARQKIEGDVAICWLSQQIVQQKNQIQSLTSLVSSMEAQLEKMRDDDRERYGS